MGETRDAEGSVMTEEAAHRDAPGIIPGCAADDATLQLREERTVRVVGAAMAWLRPQSGAHSESGRSHCLSQRKVHSESGRSPDIKSEPRQIQ